MKRIFGLIPTVARFTLSAALICLPASAWADKQTVNKLYEELNDLEIEAQKELQQIRQMKRELKASANPEENRVMEESAAHKAAEEKRRDEEQHQRQAAERKVREEQARLEAERKRKERERQLRESQLETLADDASQQGQAEDRRRKEAAAAKARQAQMLTVRQKYMALIRDRLMRAWYPPASATSSMSTTLQITLLPAGEPASVTILSASGNTAFDKSTLEAAVSVSPYPVPEDQQVFEEYFRRFPIQFNPENPQ